MREVLQRLQSVPVVERAAVANSAHAHGRHGLVAASRSRATGASPATARRRACASVPASSRRSALPVVAGRDFDERDVRPAGDKPRPYRSVIVSESFVRRYFKDQNPIGARIGLGNRPDTRTTIEIIGVVKDFSRRTLRDQQVETIFLQYFDSQSGDGTFYVRIRGGAERAFAAIRAAVAQVDPELPVRLTVFDDQIEQSLRTERMLASLSSAFGTLALLLAVIGLYGVMSFVVTQRTQEIGLRMALGASRSSALWLIVRDAVGDDRRRHAGRAAVGVGAQALRRGGAVRRQRAAPAPTIAIAGVALAAVGLGAAMLPAWRAASVNPIRRASALAPRR